MFLDAFNATDIQRIHWPHTVSCSANSSQACLYKWLHDGREVSSDKKLELLPGSPSGEYQCLAECWLNQHNCVILAHQLTYEFSANNWGSSSEYILDCGSCFCSQFLYEVRFFRLHRVCCEDIVIIMEHHSIYDSEESCPSQYCPVKTLTKKFMFFLLRISMRLFQN